MDFDWVYARDESAWWPTEAEYQYFGFQSDGTNYRECRCATDVSTGRVEHLAARLDAAGYQHRLEQFVGFSRPNSGRPAAIFLSAGTDAVNVVPGVRADFQSAAR